MPEPTEADLFGIGPQVTDPQTGQVHTIPKANQIQKAEIQRFLERRAREAVGRSADVPEAERATLLRDVVEDIASGRYSVNSRAYLKFTQSVDGIAYSYQVILKVDPETAMRLAWRHVELHAELARAKLANDPFAMAGALLAMGYPADFLSSSTPPGPSSEPSSTPHTADPSPNSGASPTTSSGTSGATSPTTPTDTPSRTPSSGDPPASP